METIEKLGFGRIEHILILDGRPCYEDATVITQEIKLGAEIEPRAEHHDASLTLKLEFERLFDQLSHLHNVVVDIEIRHAIPFRLVVKRSRQELLP